ncbi:MAG: hypothetical protein ABL949_01910 [Fimbriimonadaceae bacterium]
MKSIGWMFLGVVLGVTGVVIYQKLSSGDNATDIDALDEKVSLHLSELESRAAELAS